MLDTEPLGSIEVCGTPKKMFLQPPPTHESWLGTVFSQTHLQSHSHHHTQQRTSVWSDVVSRFNARHSPNRDFSRPLEEQNLLLSPHPLCAPLVPPPLSTFALFNKKSPQGVGMSSVQQQRPLAWSRNHVRSETVNIPNPSQSKQCASARPHCEPGRIVQ